MWNYRIKYSKKGIVRFISHLDTMRALKRAFSRAGLPMAYSEGFNPRPKISMGPPLPLGCESDCEVSDIGLKRSLSPQDIHSRLETAMPKGLDLMDIERMLPSFPKLSSVSSIRYMIELPGGLAVEAAKPLVQAFEQEGSVLVDRVRKGKHASVDVREFVRDARIVTEAHKGWLIVEVTTSERGTCSPSEVGRAVLNLSPDRARCLRAIRTEIRFENG